MAKEVKIYDIGEAAIIKSFDHLKSKKLPRHRIIEKAHELSGESEANIESRFDKFNEMNFLLRYERYEDKPGEKKKKWGVYSVNPEYEFKFECEPLPSDTVSVEIPSERREAHTTDLKAVIENWIDNFPNPPHLENTYPRFSASVKKCEDHLLFQDLENHLPVSGFDVLDKWEIYKKHVEELEESEKDLLKTLEQNVSGIFEGLPLKFVGYSTSLGEDYQCCIPQVIIDLHLEDCILQLIYSYMTKKARTNEEAEEIHREFEREFVSPSLRNMVINGLPFHERGSGLPLLERGDSIIWGYSESSIPSIQLIRIPKGRRDTLIQAKDHALAFIFKPPTDTMNGINKIAEKLRQLELEKQNLLEELNSSLYSQCFSGDCRYLGSP